MQQAARLQMVIMFMIAASGALASMIVTVLALGVVVDNEHRVRPDRIDTRPHAVWRARGYVVEKVKEGLKSLWGKVKGAVWRKKDGEEREGLLGGGSDGDRR